MRNGYRRSVFLVSLIAAGLAFLCSEGEGQNSLVADALLGQPVIMAKSLECFLDARLFVLRIHGHQQPLSSLESQQKHLSKWRVTGN